MRLSLRLTGGAGTARRDGAAAEHPRAAARRFGPSVKRDMRRLVVEVGDRAEAWRDAARASELAFLCWKNAGHMGRRDAGSLYIAAIEREEHAANEYRSAWEACCTAVPGAPVSTA
jgi:hypothetical protein